MSRSAVIRYRTRLEAADENQRLVERVFAELAEKRPEGVDYASFRLEDGVTFVHIVRTEDGADPLPELTAFKEFQQGLGDRIDGPPERGAATVIGSYGFLPE